jgi:protein phosphatase
VTIKPEARHGNGLEQSAAAPPVPVFDLSALSDVGTERQNNEDSYGCWIEGADSAVFAVADGVGGYEGGEVASAMAVEITLDAWRESPRSWSPGKRLYRAVQRANIEIHNRSLTVPELRRMATTLTAAAVVGGTLYASHVGDCRLYLIRKGRIRQLTKDHTVAGEKFRLGLLSAAHAREHPERSTLSRCLGHELIVSVDQITIPLLQGDRLVLCSDGLYNVLDDQEIEQLSDTSDAAGACRVLIDTANGRGAADNVSAAVFLMNGTTPDPPVGGFGARIMRALLSLASVRRGRSSP